MHSINPADGERRAMVGYYPQYTISASVVLDALLNRTPEQIKEKACADDHIIKTAIANTLDKFEIGVRKPIIDLMIQRMAENDRIVSKFMDDKEFQGVVYPLLAKEIFMSVNEKVIE